MLLHGVLLDEFNDAFDDQFDFTLCLLAIYIPNRFLDKAHEVHTNSVKNKENLYA